MASPTPSPSPAATPIPFATYLPGYSPVPSDAATSELEKNLRSWSKGTFKIAKSRLWHDRNSDTLPLNAQRLTLEDGQLLPTYHGVYLGSEVVDDHLIAYVGHRDGSGKTYFVPVSLGKVGSDYGVFVNSVPYRCDCQNMPNIRFVDVDDMQAFLAHASRNDAILYNAWTSETGIATDDPRFDGQEYLDAIPVARHYARWSLAVARRGKSHKDKALLNRYSLVKGVVNKRITRFDSHGTLHLNELSSAGEDLWR